MSEEVGEQSRPYSGYKYARIAGLIGFAIQLIILGLRSWHQYRSYNLSIDFNIFYNAWSQISHGTLDPFDELIKYPYWQSHFELIMWPLSIAGIFTTSAYFLLMVQNIGLAGGGYIAYSWALDICQERDQGDRRRVLLPVAASVTLILMVANPWIYLGADQDFHLQAFAFFLLVIAGKNLYTRHYKLGLAFLILTISSGDVACTYVVALGVSLIFVDRHRWKMGLAVSASGLAWLSLVGILHANHGSQLGGYLWLAGKHHSTTEVGSAMVLVGLGLLRHPVKVGQTFFHRWLGNFHKLAPTGGVGVLSPFVLPICLLILIENTLIDSQFFRVPSFQDTPLLIASGAGLLVMAWNIGTIRNWTHLAVYPVLVTLGVYAIYFDAHPPIPLELYKVAPSAAAQLDTVLPQITYGDEVVSSFGVAGRFSGRKHYFTYNYLPLTVPVRSNKVFFVFVPQDGNAAGVPPQDSLAAADYVRNTLKATPLVQSDRVQAYKWIPPSGTTTITLPTGPIYQIPPSGF